MPSRDAQHLDVKRHVSHVTCSNGLVKTTRCDVWHAVRVHSGLAKEEKWALASLVI